MVFKRFIEHKQDSAFSLSSFASTKIEFGAAEAAASMACQGSTDQGSPDLSEISSSSSRKRCQEAEFEPSPLPMAYSCSQDSGADQDYNFDLTPFQMVRGHWIQLGKMDLQVSQ